MKRLTRPLLIAAVAAAALGLAACASPAPSVVGDWGDSGDQREPSLTFEKDGKYHGPAGCNRVSGSWQADGNIVDLGVMISTLMACEGVDTWLTNAKTAEVKGDTLVFVDENENEIGTLERED